MVLKNYLCMSLGICFIGTIATIMLLWSYDYELEDNCKITPWDGSFKTLHDNDDGKRFLEKRVPQFVCWMVSWISTAVFLLLVYVKSTDAAANHPTSVRISTYQLPLFIMWIMWPLVLVNHLWAAKTSMWIGFTISLLLAILSMVPVFLMENKFDNTSHTIMWVCWFFIALSQIWLCCVYGSYASNFKECEPI